MPPAAWLVLANLLPPACAFARQFEGCLEFDTLGRIGQIAAPTLVTVGKQDMLPPVELSQELAGGILNAELIMLEHGGHNFMREISDQFNQVVLDFLAKAQ